MSKLGLLLGELLEMKLSGEEMAALVGPLYGKMKEEKEQILEPIIQKMKTERASAPSTPMQMEE